MIHVSNEDDFQTKSRKNRTLPKRLHRFHSNVVGVGTDGVNSAAKTVFNLNKSQLVLLKESDLVLSITNEMSFARSSTEIPFSFEIEGVEVPIIGAIDLIEEDEQGNLIIVDHKTTSRAYSKSDIDKSLQLTLYHMAALSKEREANNPFFPLHTQLY